MTGTELLHPPASPFVRTLVMAAIEAGREADLTLVPVSGTPLSPGALPTGVNPPGRIPALRRADGRILFDSRGICRLLDHDGGTGLSPGARCSGMHGSWRRCPTGP